MKFGKKRLLAMKSFFKLLSFPLLKIFLFSYALFKKLCSTYVEQFWIELFILFPLFKAAFENTVINRKFPLLHSIE